VFTRSHTVASTTTDLVAFLVRDAILNQGAVLDQDAISIQIVILDQDANLIQVAVLDQDAILNQDTVLDLDILHEEMVYLEELVIEIIDQGVQAIFQEDQ
jgi:hypothetical protein